jgi:hypothetical protein
MLCKALVQGSWGICLDFVGGVAEVEEEQGSFWMFVGSLYLLLSIHRPVAVVLFPENARNQLVT